jgi:hypothetical protein
MMVKAKLGFEGSGPEILDNIQWRRGTSSATWQSSSSRFRLRLEDMLNWTGPVQNETRPAS